MLYFIIIKGSGEGRSLPCDSQNSCVCGLLHVFFVSLSLSLSRSASLARSLTGRFALSRCNYWFELRNRKKGILKVNGRRLITIINRIAVIQLSNKATTKQYT